MAIHQGQTDQSTKIQLPSAIVQVMWGSRMAAAGATVGLQVLTSFVGSGAELKIELADTSGKNFGTFKDRIANNKFGAQITVPDGARDGLYATVKLPKHGLSMKSYPLLVVPPIEITNLKWGQKEARRGDLVKLTADVKGVPDGAEAQMEIWEHDQDGAHDFITKFPAVVKNKKIEAEWEYEYHEDTDGIPTDAELKRYGKTYSPPEYFFCVRLGGASASSAILEFKDWIELELRDIAGSRLPNIKYSLILPDGTRRTGQLDNDGLAREDNIPPGPVDVEWDLSKTPLR
jgi:hypothetical protein